MQLEAQQSRIGVMPVAGAIGLLLSYLIVHGMLKTVLNALGDALRTDGSWSFSVPRAPELFAIDVLIPEIALAIILPQVLRNIRSHRSNCKLWATVIAVVLLSPIIFDLVEKLVSRPYPLCLSQVRVVCDGLKNYAFLPPGAVGAAMGWIAFSVLAIPITPVFWLIEGRWPSYSLRTFVAAFIAFLGLVFWSLPYVKLGINAFGASG